MAQWSVRQTKRNNNEKSAVERPSGQYAADESAVADIARGLSKRHQSTHIDLEGIQTRVHATTPEGFQVAEYNVQAMMGGHKTPAEVREETNRTVTRSQLPVDRAAHPGRSIGHSIQTGFGHLRTPQTRPPMR